jgi:hypothetical protein
VDERSGDLRHFRVSPGLIEQLGGFGRRNGPPIQCCVEHMLALSSG